MGYYNYPLARSYFLGLPSFDDITKTVVGGLNKVDNYVKQGQTYTEEQIHKGGVDYLSSPDLHNQVQNLAANKGHDAAVDALNEARGTISQYLPFILAGVIGLAVLFYFL